MRLVIALSLLLLSLVSAKAAVVPTVQHHGVCADHGVIVDITYCGRFSSGGAPPPTPSGGGPPLAACVFYVAPSGGSDSNLGTSSAPFATLEHAAVAMQGVSTHKVTCLKAGTYNRVASMNLGSADSNEVWQADPAAGFNTAIIDGGSTVDGLFILNGATGVTFNGLKMQNPVALAIAGASGMVVANSDIGFNHNNNSGLGYGGFAPLIDLHGPDSHAFNNYVHDCASQCIAMYAFAAGESIDLNTVENNVVLRAVQQADDGGCIYVNMHATSTAGGHVTVQNNFCRDQGGQFIGGVAGIYLDDNASNVTVKGNVIGPVALGWQGSAARRDADCIEIYGGVGPVTPNQPQNDTITDNICDLGSSARMLIVGAGPEQGQTNNSFTNNIVVSSYSGATGTQQFCPGSEYCGQSTGLTVANNAYHNFGGGDETTTGTPGDASPQHYSASQLGLSGYLYAMAPGSAVQGTPISFVPPVGGWGPRGFVIQTSTNHSPP